MGYTLSSFPSVLLETARGGAPAGQLVDPADLAAMGGTRQPAQDLFGDGVRPQLGGRDAQLDERDEPRVRPIHFWYGWTPKVPSTCCPASSIWICGPPQIYARPRASAESTGWFSTSVNVKERIDGSLDISSQRSAGSCWLRLVVCYPAAWCIAACAATSIAANMRWASSGVSCASSSGR
jgi:hypothetical protein